jgi:hypothetical protein
MTKTTPPGFVARRRICVCIGFTLLVLFSDVVQACAQWVFPWPDSSNLPAGATQYGNVFPGGNLWDGSTLYTPANLPQRYLTWDCGDPWDGLPRIHGASDPGMATYRDSGGTFRLGLDRYNLDGVPMTAPLPTSPNDEVWENCLTGHAGENFFDGIPGNPTTVAGVGPYRMMLFLISNPGNPGPNSETHVWVSLDYFFDIDAGDVPVLPLAFLCSPGGVTNGWYHEPADSETEKWGRFGFALSFGPNCEAETLALVNAAPHSIYFDSIQITAVTVPEPGTCGLVAFGALALVVSRCLRRPTAKGSVLTINPCLRSLR